MMLEHDLLNDRQAKPRSHLVFPSGFVPFIEPFEDMRQGIFIDPASCIGNGDIGFPAYDRGLDSDAVPLICKFQRVIQQVIDDPLDQIRIGTDIKLFLK